MKNSVKTFTYLLGLYILAGCHDITTEDVTFVTTFVTFEMEGKQVISHPMGASYQDPGVRAFENGVEVTSKMQTSGSVNTDETGIYSISYSATNADGVPNSTSRTIVVYEPTPSIMKSGMYTVSSDSNRDGDNSLEYANGNTVFIYQVEPGIFYISDLFGGYYEIGRRLGSNFATAGWLALTGTDISLCKSDITPWGDSFDSVSGTYNESTKTLTYTGLWDDFVFSLIMSTE